MGDVSNSTSGFMTSATSVTSSKTNGNHAALGQYGVTNTNDVRSLLIFARLLETRPKGGKA